MEVLKNLSEHELTSLRDRFLSAEDNALELDEFEEVIRDACKDKPSINIENLRLKELFSDIDINGDSTVSWDEFTMFLINGATQRTESDEDSALRAYTAVRTIRDSEIPNSIADIRYLPRLGMVMKTLRRDRSSRLKLCLPNDTLTPQLEVPLTTDMSILSAEHIPLCSDVRRSGTIAVSYSDSVVRFYETKQSTLPGAAKREMPLVKETRMLESQTALRWSSEYSRLVLGSRTGVVSVLDVDQHGVFSKERLHNLLIRHLTLSGTDLYTASVDPTNSVKIIDLQRSVVKVALDGHAQGASMVEVSAYHNQIFTCGFERWVLVYSVTLPKLAPYRLFDPHRPHKGRIVGMQVLPSSPQLVTADSAGLVKIWDLRMFQCAQTIMPQRATEAGDGPESGRITAIGIIPPQRRLLVCGRDINVFEYEDVSSPNLADDQMCGAVLYNPVSHTFLSVHGRNVKLWDAVTGALRASHDDALPSDITCICLETPLSRRFFAGCLDGRVYNIGYAMCQVLREYDAEFTGATSAAVDIQFMESFRDSKNRNPYVIVGHVNGVTLLPDAEEHVQRNALILHCLGEVLVRGVTVRCVGSSHNNYVLVGTSDGRIHVVDLTTFSLTLSWGARSLVGEVTAMRLLDIPTSSVSCVIYAADAAGNAHCALMANSAEIKLICSWAATDHTPVELVPRPPEPQQYSLQAEAEARLASQLMPRASVVANYFTADRTDVFRPMVTCIATLEELDIIVTGDDRGYVVVWDVSLLGPDDDAPATRIIHHWRAHEAEITSMSQCARGELACIVTAAQDQQVLLWSLDGVCLGNLALGRSESEQGGAPSRGILPFKVDVPPAEAWEHFKMYKYLKHEPTTARNLASSANMANAHNNNQGEEHEKEKDALEGTILTQATATFLTQPSLVATPKPPSQALQPASARGILRPGMLPPNRMKRKAPAPPPPPPAGFLPAIPKSRMPRPRSAPRSLPATSSPRDYLGAIAASSCSTTPRKGSFSLLPPAPTTERTHLASVGSGTRRQLQAAGLGDDPFETYRERALRERGSVVLGTHTEPSNRVR